ncbi:hypothetical protein Ahy_A04g019962 isoform B [Arachis hypogaea]|uniref:Uncharacterized protein n=1 Tax=Arachis hypogaea TaxID=3818 RepID=A0A445DGU7_ARAHY|nr:hypothetical protein Ahy_A04g019962 isoform B [Arachis hypogaea]
MHPSLALCLSHNQHIGMASYSLSGISLVNRLWIRNPQSLALCLSHHQHIGMASYSLSAAVSLSRKPSFDSEHSIVAVSPSIGTVSTEHSILNWKDSAGNTILHRATLNDNNQCHYSYSACGLGSDATDKLVHLV